MLTVHVINKHSAVTHTHTQTHRTLSCQPVSLTSNRLTSAAHTDTQRQDLLTHIFHLIAIFHLSIQIVFVLYALRQLSSTFLLLIKDNRGEWSSAYAA